LAAEALQAAFGRDWHARIQLPVALDDESEPEPDVSMVPGSPRDYRDAHPTRPAVIVEVAEASLGHDREHKASLYARAHVPEYWIVNLVDRVLETYREPVPSPEAPYGWAYRRRLVLGPAELVSPLSAPSSRVRVADLLP
ncbi:MAG: Uma2 family endonuclease, partial [Acidobacteriota bacterium]